jgi:thiol-disulfide isomerase/thioredoxin
MKFFLHIVATFLFVLTICTFDFARGHDNSSTNLFLKDIYGNDVSIEKFSGNITIITFWSTWCSSCCKAISSMDILAKYFKEQDVSFALVSTLPFKGRSPIFYLRNKDYNYFHIYFDYRGESSRSFGIRYLPTTLVFDKYGKLMCSINGLFNTNSLGMILFIKNLLKYQS